MRPETFHLASPGLLLQSLINRGVPKTNPDTSTWTQPLDQHTALPASTRTGTEIAWKAQTSWTRCPALSSWHIPTTARPALRLPSSPRAIPLSPRSLSTAHREAASLHLWTRPPAVLTGTAMTAGTGRPLLQLVLGATRLMFPSDWTVHPPPLLTNHLNVVTALKSYRKKNWTRRSKPPQVTTPHHLHWRVILALQENFMLREDLVREVAPRKKNTEVH